MSRIELKLLSYGHPQLAAGAYLDPTTYENVDAMLSGRWRDIVGDDPAYFSKGLLDLSLFCDVFCIRDDVMCFAPQAGEEQPRFLASAFWPHGGAATGVFASDLKVLNFLSIDEEQRSRVLSRWFALAGSAYAKKDKSGLSLAPVNIQEVLLGVLIEEMLQSSAYIPGATTVEAYLATDPREIEFKTHNLFISAMNHLETSYATKVATRALLSGSTQAPIPPILALVLDKVSSPEEIGEELCDWRRKFRPLRRRYAELAEIGRSADVPEKTWVREYTKLNRDIARFLARFELKDPWQTVPGINPWDVATGHEKLSADGWTSELNLKMSSVVKLGFDSILHALRRARLRPLPTLAAKLGRLKSSAANLERVFKRPWTETDTAMFQEIAAVQNRRLQMYRSMAVTSVSASRPQPSTDKVGSPFHLDSIFDEFAAWGTMGKSAAERAETVLNVGLISLEDKAFPRAHRLLVKAIGMAPRTLRGKWRQIGSTGRAALGQLHDRFGRVTEAEELYRSALALDPGNAWVLNDYGAFLCKHKKSAALDLLQKAVAVDPTMQPAWMNLGTMHSSRGEDDKAIACFREAGQLGGPHAALAFTKLSLLLTARDEHAAAAEALREATRFQPDDDMVWSALAGALAQANDYQGAHDAACTATSINSSLKNDQGWVELSAELARLAGNHGMTIDLLKPIVNSQKVTANSLFHYALANHVAGNRSLVAKSLRAAQRLDPKSTRYLPLLFKLQRESEDHRAALRTTRLFQKLFPQYPLGMVLEGDASLSLDRWDNALSAYRRAVQHGFASTSKFYNLAVAKEREEDWGAAIELHKLHIAAAGDDAACYANMAADYYELGNREEALSSARRAVELDPSDPLNLNMLANIYLSIKDYDAATPLLTRVASMESAPAAVRTTAAHNLAALDASKRR